jgi:SulP family sulfate permease
MRLVAISLAAGGVAGLLDLGVLLSLAALVFSGPLTGFVANGIGLVLVGTCVMGLAFGLASSRPGFVIIIQDAPAVVVALVAAGVAAGASPTVDSAGLYATVIAAIALTTLATGVAFVLLGQFRLGSLIRYLPYPVVGGFLAGTGWLLVLGGVSVMIGAQPSFADLPGLIRQPVLWQWLPGVAFAVVMLVVLRRTQHALALPGLVIAAAALFFIWLALSGISLAEAQANGWLLGPFPQQALWSPLTPAMLTQIDWPAIAGQASAIGAAVVISVIGLLLNVSGLQLARREDIDLNRELRAAGIAQLAAGLVGSMPGYHTLSLSVLVDRMGARTRLVTIVTAVVGGIAFFAGGDIIALMPRVVLGAIIVFLGLGFLSEWLYDAWFQLPRLDYALIVIILALIAVFGILPGVVAGLAIAVVLFVVVYSRIDVVKHALSGATVKSRMNRGHAEQLLLRDQGEQIAIFQLQGFIFFGTAHDLYERVRQRATRADLPALRFVLLDFRLVPRLDSTALLSFTKMLQLAEAQGLTLIFTQLGPAVRRQIAQGLPHSGAGNSVRIFPDLDRGLEWCENELLAAANIPGGAGFELRELLAPDPDAMLAYFERRVVGPGEYLIHQGEQPEDMFFVESGQVTAQIETEGAAPLRLETMRGGRAVGELGFFLNRRRTAAVVADEISAVYRITWAGLRRMEREQPDAAASFHLLIARLLSERVVHLIDTVDALQR